MSQGSRRSGRRSSILKPSQAELTLGFGSGEEEGREATGGVGRRSRRVSFANQRQCAHFEEDRIHPPTEQRAFETSNDSTPSRQGASGLSLSDQDPPQALLNTMGLESSAGEEMSMSMSNLDEQSMDLAETTVFGDRSDASESPGGHDATDTGLFLTGLQARPDPTSTPAPDRSLPNATLHTTFGDPDRTQGFLANLRAPSDEGPASADLSASANATAFANTTYGDAGRTECFLGGLRRPASASTTLGPRDMDESALSDVPPSPQAPKTPSQTSQPMSQEAGTEEPVRRPLQDLNPAQGLDESAASSNMSEAPLSQSLTRTAPPPPHDASKDLFQDSSVMDISLAQPEAAAEEAEEEELVPSQKDSQPMETEELSQPEPATPAKAATTVLDGAEMELISSQKSLTQASPRPQVELDSSVGEAEAAGPTSSQKSPSQGLDMTPSPDPTPSKENVEETPRRSLDRSPSGLSPEMKKARPSTSPMHVSHIPYPESLPLEHTFEMAAERTAESDPSCKATKARQSASPVHVSQLQGPDLELTAELSAHMAAEKEETPTGPSEATGTGRKTRRRSLVLWLEETVGVTADSPRTNRLSSTAIAGASFSQFTEVADLSSIGPPSEHTDRSATTGPIAPADPVAQPSPDGTPKASPAQTTPSQGTPQTAKPTAPATPRGLTPIQPPSIARLRGGASGSSARSSLAGSPKGTPKGQGTPKSAPRQLSTPASRLASAVRRTKSPLKAPTVKPMTRLSISVLDESEPVEVDTPDWVVRTSHLEELSVLDGADETEEGAVVLNYVEVAQSGLLKSSVRNLEDAIRSASEEIQVSLQVAEVDEELKEIISRLVADPAAARGPEEKEALREALATSREQLIVFCAQGTNALKVAVEENFRDAITEEETRQKELEALERLADQDAAEMATFGSQEAQDALLSGQAAALATKLLSAQASDEQDSEQTKRLMMTAVELELARIEAMGRLSKELAAASASAAAEAAAEAESVAVWASAASQSEEDVLAASLGWGEFRLSEEAFVGTSGPLRLRLAFRGEELVEAEMEPVADLREQWSRGTVDRLVGPFLVGQVARAPLDEWRKRAGGRRGLPQLLRHFRRYALRLSDAVAELEELSALVGPSRVRINRHSVLKLTLLGGGPDGALEHCEVILGHTPLAPPVLRKVVSYAGRLNQGVIKTLSEQLPQSTEQLLSPLNSPILDFATLLLYNVRA